MYQLGKELEDKDMPSKILGGDRERKVDKMVAGSSLTPHAALLVHPSGTIHPVVDCHEFTWSDKCWL